MDSDPPPIHKMDSSRRGEVDAHFWEPEVDC